jgi:hypothetical protein
MTTERSNEKQTPNPPNASESDGSELDEEQLVRVSAARPATGDAGAGRVAVRDISITKVVDKSPP